LSTLYIIELSIAQQLLLLRLHWSSFKMLTLLVQFYRALSCFSALLFIYINHKSSSAVKGCNTIQ